MDRQHGSIEVELCTGIPRPVRFKIGPQFGRIAAWAAMIAAAALIAHLGNVDITELQALKRNGKPVTARVTDRWVTQGKHTTYSLEFQYEVGERTYSRHQNVDFDVYRDKKVGADLNIVCLPEQPSVYRIGSVDGLRVMRGYQNWGLGLVLLIGFEVFLGGMMEYCFRTQHRILKLGEAITAEIVSCTLVKGKSNYYKVTYRFNTLSHGMKTEKADLSSSIGRRLQEGGTATVLYDPESKESRLYIALNTVEIAR